MHPIPTDTPSGVTTGSDGHEYDVLRELTGRYAIDGLCITEVQERVTYDGYPNPYARGDRFTIWRPAREGDVPLN